MIERKELYSMSVDATYNRGRLVQITGSRETVIDVALRVILDSAPVWDPRNMTTPMFQVNVSRFKR